MKTTRVRSGWQAAARAIALVLGCSVFAPSCAEESGPIPKFGSATHFLTRCESEDNCEAGFSCLCGACTRTCEGAGACQTLDAGAQCVAVAARPLDPGCPDSAVTAFCDFGCTENSECAVLGDGYRCDRGYCRALSDSCQTGTIAGSEVVLLGDTFMAVTREIPQALQALARESGALAPNESYRDYSMVVQNNLAAEPEGLSAQYTTAQQEGVVKAVIMAGGGADVLLGSCPEPVAPDCPLLQNVLAGAEALWSRMANDGVEHVVFFFYPDYVGDARVKNTVDVLRPLLQERCAAAQLPCHWLDLRPTFAGKYDEYVRPDGANPTTAGAQASAEAIWGLMQQRCIAQ